MADGMQSQTTPVSQVEAVSSDPRWRRNRQLAWCSFALGATTGLVMGLWSFDGPMAVPGWLGDYAATSRRLARLGHIACFGLGLLNLLLVRELASTSLEDAAKRIAAGAMNLGNAGLPLTLFAAALYPPLKYLLPVSALAVTVALVLTAWGVSSVRRAQDDRGDEHEDAR